MSFLEHPARRILQQLSHMCEVIHLDERHHLIDVFGCVGAIVGPKNAECVEDRLVVDRLPLRGDLGFGRTLASGSGDDVVVDVGDVGDVVNVETCPRSSPRTLPGS